MSVISQKRLQVLNWRQRGVAEYMVASSPGHCPLWAATTWQNRLAYQKLFKKCRTEEVFFIIMTAPGQIHIWREGKNFQNFLGKFRCTNRRAGTCKADWIFVSPSLITLVLRFYFFHICEKKYIICIFN